jgi:cytoskeletal protein CcmA (bactofilin family)
LQVRGTVDGNVRSAGNTAVISGSVGKNVMWFGDVVTVESTGKVGGSVTMFGDSLAIDGHVGRDILFFGTGINVNGAVEGGIREKGHTLIIGANAQVGGPIHFEGDKPAEVSSSAKLASPVEFKQMEHRKEYRDSSYYIWQVIWASAYILFGLVLFALMPNFSEEAVKATEQYGAAAGLGILVGCGLPIAALIACVTVVGLFIGISTLFLWYAALHFGQIVVAALIGQWLMGRTQEIWPLVGRMVVGFVLLRLCTMIPHVGWVFKYGAAFWGIGAISLVVYRRLQPVIAPGMPSGPYTPPLPPSTTMGGVQPA